MEKPDSRHEGNGGHLFFDSDYVLNHQGVQELAARIPPQQIA